MGHNKKVNIFLKNIFGVPPVLIKESKIADKIKLIWNFCTRNMNMFYNSMPKISEKRHMQWSLQKEKSQLLYTTNLYTPNITSFCYFCIDHGHAIFLTKMFPEVKTHSNVRCRKKSVFFEFVYYFWQKKLPGSYKLRFSCEFLI
jgi:hypothetical protein